MAKYTFTTYRRKQGTSEFTVVNQETLDRYSDYRNCSVLDDFVIVHNHKTGTYHNFCRKDFYGDVDGQIIFGCNLFGVPVVEHKDDMQIHSVTFAQVATSWRNRDFCVHFDRSIHPQDFQDVHALIAAIENALKNIHGQSQAANHGRMLACGGENAYRAYNMGEVYFAIYLIHQRTGARVVTLNNRVGIFYY